MAKLYFKYGAMGSSKTAQALITRFNYQEMGMKVWLIKPSTDSRDGMAVIRSRVGLEAEAVVILPEHDLYDLYRHFVEKNSAIDVIIADEAQFFTQTKLTRSDISWIRKIYQCFVSACVPTFSLICFQEAGAFSN
jgi:thymidine kinase